MKVVHNNTKTHLSKTELFDEAKEAEASEDWKTAETYYQEIIKTDPHNEAAYNRLMIVYRKQKEWNKELQLVKKAIAGWEEFYGTVGKKKNNKVSRLSNSFLKVAGLADKKGKPLYLPGPLAKWKKRKATLEKKAGKK
jgi:tetratricopeptide (TPR) repeat protein